MSNEENNKETLVVIPQDVWIETMEKELCTFPCKRNSKEPDTLHGFKDAKLGRNIKEFIRKGNNIGLAMSVSGLICLDADVDTSRGLDGIKTIKELEELLGELPSTLTQSTPRGGRHYIFNNFGIKNPIAKIGNAVDVKYKGYILACPSEINGKKYEIIDGYDGEQFYASLLPSEWIEYLNRSDSDD